MTFMVKIGNTQSMYVVQKDAIKVVGMAYHQQNLMTAVIFIVEQS